MQPWLTGGPGRKINCFEGELIRDFHWSHPGKQLVVARGHLNGSVELISNFHSRLVNRLIDTRARAVAEYPSLQFGNCFRLLGAAL